jgi:hypothetical protein
LLDDILLREVDKMLSSLFEENLLNEITLNLTMLQNIVIPFAFPSINCTINKAVEKVMWLDVSLKKEGTMISLS